MYIISLNYLVDIEQVEKHIDSHVEYLKEQYSKGYFIASGRKIPRTGGIILSNIKDRELLDSTIEKDPFKINNIAEYNITEFIPSMTSKELEHLK